VPETVQQYTARILGFAGDRDPVKVQAATPGRLRRLIRGRSARALSRVPTGGKWSVREILAHLADAEVVHAYRLRMILSRDGTDIQAYDQNLWAATGRYDAVPVEQSLSVFETLRRANVALLKRLTAAERRRYGMHQERGKESIARLSQMYAGHDLNHLSQIERILKSRR
jgi:hypothetical protein